MAKLAAGVSFTGRIGNLSAYKMRGVEGIILRQKGGASKEKIKTSADFVNTRKVNSEFGGRSRASKWLRGTLGHQSHIADFNLAGPLNALMKPVQLLDAESKLGERNIELSKNPYLLEGFSLNRRTYLDSIIRSPLKWSISRDTLSARIDIPALMPGFNFFPAEKYPLYTIVTSLGIMPDLFYTSDGYKPSSDEYKLNASQAADTGWLPVLKGSPALSLAITLPKPPPDQSFSLVLAVGVRYGTMRDASVVWPVNYVGAARILAMA
jgi:hypothetical protein